MVNNDTDSLIAMAEGGPHVDSTDALIAQAERGSPQPAPQPQQGPFEAVGKAWQARADKWAASEQVAPSQSPLEASYRIVGQLAGAVGDVPGAIIGEAAREFLPQPVKNAIKSAIGTVAGSAPVQAATSAYQNFQQQNPRAAANVSAGLGVVNLASNLIPGAAAAKPIQTGVESFSESALKGAGEAASSIGKTLAPKVETAATPAVTQAFDDLTKVPLNPIKLESMGGDPLPSRALPSFDDIVKQAEKEVPKAEPQSGVQRFTAPLENADRSALYEPHGGETVPYTTYAKQAIESSPKTGKYGVATPLDLVGNEGTKASAIIDHKLQQVGNELGNIEETATTNGVNNSVFVDTRPLKQQLLSEFQNKLGFDINPDGSLKPFAGMEPKDPTQISVAKEIANKISGLNDEETAENVNSTIRSLKDFVEEPKKSQFKTSISPTELVANTLRDGARSQLEDYIGSQISPEEAQRFGVLRGNYAQLKDLSGKLSDMLGQKVSYVDESGNTVETTSKGASIAKRAIQSNADSGAKAVFAAVKNATGIDLMKNSAFATIAMRTAGDPRELNLLKSMGALADIKTGGITKIAGEIASRTPVVKNYTNQLKASVDYYNRAQKQGRRISDFAKPETGTPKTGTSPSVQPLDSQASGLVVASH